MNDTQLTLWGARYGLTLDQVKRLRRLVNAYAKQQERSCNGDWHPFAKNGANKNECSEAWSQDSIRTAAKLEYYAKACGFDRVDFSVGLYPALRKGSEDSILIPE